MYSQDELGISIDDEASPEKVIYKFENLTSNFSLQWLYLYRTIRYFLGTERTCGISHQKRNSESRIGLTREIAKISYNIAKPFPRMHADMTCKCDRIEHPFYLLSRLRYMYITALPSYPTPKLVQQRKYTYFNISETELEVTHGL